MAAGTPAPAAPSTEGDTGPEANARLTGATAGVLLVLLAAEGATLLSVRSLLAWHVFIGMLVVPPVALKISTTGYRFARYYLGSASYRHRGPPPSLMRLIGPLVVATTVVLLASGVALLLVGPSLRSTTLFVHKASFVLWFGVMTLHVLGHLGETARLAPSDWTRRRRSAVPRAGLRQWTLVASVACGIPLGLALVPLVPHWLGSAGRFVH